MLKLKNFLQKIRVEFFILGSFVFTVIAFSANYYKVQFAGQKGGYSIFDEIFGANLGWLFFLIALGGYITTIVFTTIDNKYSERARLSFLSTIIYITVIFTAVILSVVLADNSMNSKFYFGNETFMGVTLRGGLGFGFYWYIIHIILSGAIVLLYKGYQGEGEETCYNWLLEKVNKNQDPNKPKIKQTGNKYDELTKIKKLLDDGVLTNEEYLKEKQLILDKYS